MVTKENDIDGASNMRWMLDRAFRVCLGRGTWKEDIIITGTLEQWATFCYLLHEKDMKGAFTAIKVEMFIPLKAEPEPHIFDASGETSKVLCLPKRPIQPPSPSEVS